MGSETIRGVDSTHYTVDVELDRVVARVPAAQRAQTQSYVQSVEKLLGAKTMPIDVYVAGGRITRMEMNFDFCVEQEQASESVKFDFYDYGPQYIPPAPSDSDAADITDGMKANAAKALAEAC